MIRKGIARIFGGGAKAPPPNSVVLNPVRRVAGMDFSAGRTWLGGRPVLGGAAWPRNPKDGDALHMVAQVALADLPDVGAKHPRKGTLAFFVESDLSGKIEDLPTPQIAGAVVWSSDAEGPVADVSSDCGAIYRQDWSYYWQTARSEADAPRVFPRWSLEAMSFTCPREDAYWKPNGEYVEPKTDATYRSLPTG